MKVVLAALNAKYVHSNLAVFDIEAYTKENWNVEFGSYNGLDLIVKEYTINHNLGAIMQSLYKEKASVIAFSCYIWNISEVLHICRELKKVSPNLIIWLGGPEVSYDSEKLLKENGYLDGVIIGEGEKTFYEIVKLYNSHSKVEDKEEDSHIRTSNVDFSNIPDISKIFGVAFRTSEGEIVTTPSRPLLSMDEIPFIYKDLDKFENKILYYESSRGCPFSCSYCLSSIDKSVRFRNLTLVKNELKFLMDNRVRQVKFIDRTFNCDKKRAREIWRYLSEKDNGVTNFHFEIAADLIEEEDLAIFKTMRPGLIQLEIGLQSTNSNTIQEIRRVMDVDKLKHNMLAVRKMGNIHQHLDLIAGLPYENYESFVRSFNDAYVMRPNQLQLGFLKVLKGSYMEEQAEKYGLVYQDEQPYEVLATKWISYEEILKLKRVEEMVELYYNSDQFEHVLPYMETFCKTPFEMFELMGVYYEKKGYMEIGLKREMRYEVLRDFFFEDILEDIIDKDRYVQVKNIFEGLLTFDYYLRENAKSRPSWSKEYPIDKEIYNNFFKCGGTEELSLINPRYDSKVAARSMHIEPIVAEVAILIEALENNIDINDIISPMSISKNMKNKDYGSNIKYVVYDYGHRNPLSGDAAFKVISHL